MTSRGTIVLWGVAVALGAYLWLTQPPARHGPEHEPAGTTGPPLLDFRPEDVSIVVITGTEGTLALRREGLGWRDDRGFPWPSPGLLETVLETLAGTRAIAGIEDAPANPGDYGLDPPQWSITMAVSRTPGAAAGGGSDPHSGEAPGSLTLLVGDRNPAWTGVYARVPPAERVVLIGSVLAWELDKLFGAARHADPEQSQREHLEPECADEH